MDSGLGLAIKNLRRDTRQPLAWWKDIIARLTVEFERFVGESCIHDADPTIDLDAPSFNLWIWSTSNTPSLLSNSWSGVMACGLLADDEFSITMDIFLFHSRSRARLQTTNGRSLIHFRFDLSTSEWDYQGWTRDEWGEWEGLAFPDAE